MINDSNVRIPDDQLQDVIRLVANGKSGMDIHRAGIRNSNGVPVSERQAQRYAAKAKQIISQSDPEMLKNFLNAETYMPEFEIEEEESDYQTVIVPKTNNRSCVFDIEVNSPSFGAMTRYSHFLICASFFPLDAEEPYTLTLNFEEKRDDRWLLYDVMNELAKYTFVIGHNVKAYDLNWLFSRIMTFGWETPKRLFYYDTYQASKRIPILARKSLGRLIDLFNYDEAVKTDVTPMIWDRISSNKEQDFNEAMEKIVYHCSNDVKANRYIYDVMMQYDPAPRWGLWPLNG